LRAYPGSTGRKSPTLKGLRIVHNAQLLQGWDTATFVPRVCPKNGPTLCYLTPSGSKYKESCGRRVFAIGSLMGLLEGGKLNMCLLKGLAARCVGLFRLGFDTTRHKTASHSTAGFRYDSPKDGQSLNHQPRLNLPLTSLTRIILVSSTHRCARDVHRPGLLNLN